MAGAIDGNAVADLQVVQHRLRTYRHPLHIFLHPDAGHGAYLFHNTRKHSLYQMIRFTYLE